MSCGKASFTKVLDGFGAASSNLSVLDTEADQNDHRSGGCSHVFRREHVLHLKT